MGYFCERPGVQFVPGSRYSGQSNTMKSGGAAISVGGRQRSHSNREMSFWSKTSARWQRWRRTLHGVQHDADPAPVHAGGGEGLEAVGATPHYPTTGRRWNRL